MKTLINTLLASFLLGITSFAQTPDPKWSALHHISGDGQERMRDMVIDVQGNSYMIFDYNMGFTYRDVSIACAGRTDIGIMKVNPSGEADWLIHWGGPGAEFGYGIDINEAGLLVVTGAYSETVDFSGTIHTAVGATDIFVSALTSEGQVLWTESAGGRVYDFAGDVKIDHNDDIILTGWYSDQASFQGTCILSADNNDLFLAKYSALGELTFVKTFGGLGSDVAHSLAIDEDNNYIIGGQFENDLAGHGADLTSNGVFDAFVLKTNPDGNVLWNTSFGNLSNESIFTVSTDERNRIYVGGYFTQTIEIGSYALVSEGFDDAFMAIFAPDGTPEWATRFYGSGWEYTRGIDVGPEGQFAVVGYFSGAMNAGEATLYATGGEYDYEIFLTEFNKDRLMTSATSLGGMNSDFGYNVTYDVAGNLYVAGEFYADFMKDEVQLLANGSSDIFIMKYGEPLAPVQSIERSISADYQAMADTIVVQLKGNATESLHFLSFDAEYEPSKLTYSHAKVSDSLGGHPLFISGEKNDHTLGVSLGKTDDQTTLTGELVNLYFLRADPQSKDTTYVLFKSAVAEDANQTSIEADMVQTLSIALDAANYVWPGDTDQSTMVNGEDILALGYNWGLTGEPRAQATIEWMGQPAPVWTEEAQHSDTDGNGVIDQNDLKAIIYNFGRSQEGIIAKRMQNAEVTMSTSVPIGQLKAGESTHLVMMASAQESFLGFTSSLHLNGLDASDFQIEDVHFGDWYAPLKQNNGAISYVKQIGNEIVVAVAAKGRDQTLTIDEAALFVTIAIKATKDWEDEAFVQHSEFTMKSSDGTTRKPSAPSFFDSVPVSNETELPLPSRVQLLDNYPNPFNPSTSINFSVPERQKIKITVYDMLGHSVAHLLSDTVEAGYHSITFEAGNLSSGTYIVSLTSEGYVLTQKVTLVK